MSEEQQTPHSTPQSMPPFYFVRYYDPVNLLNILQHELPQTIAVVLAYMESDKAALILQNLPYKIMGDVLQRIAALNSIDSEILHGIEQALKEQLSEMGSTYAAGGIDNAVEILNLADGAAEKEAVRYLDDNDPELAEEIKKRLFVFNDIVMLDDRAIQKVLREVDSQELAKALKGASTEAQKKIFRNLSKRAAAMLREDMEYMGPIRVKDVEEAQQKIISIIRHLEDTGEIIVARTGEDMLIVGNTVMDDESDLDFTSEEKA